MKFLVLCSGLYMSLANALADGGKNTVWYLTMTESAFPKYAEFAPGNNFGYLKKVRLIDIHKYAKEADAIVTFDTGVNGLIELFRNIYPDKCVFGAGLGEKLETNRVAFKKMLEVLELDVIPYVVIKGFDALRKYLKANPKKVIKAEANFRGDFETLIAKDYDSIKQILDDRQPLFGIYSEEIEFIVEDMVDCVVESGFDGIHSAGEFTAISYGYEVAKNGYIGKVTRDVPEILMETLEAFQPIFEKFGYAGMVSTEERIVSRNKHFFIDPCCRGPLPLGVLYARFIKNFAEVVYKAGRNEPFEIECDHKYFGAFALSTGNAKEHFTLVKIKKGHEDDFRFEMATQDKDKNIYSVKGLETVVVSVAGGETPEEVTDKLKDSVNYVEAFNLETDEIKGVDEILDVIEKGKTVGVEF